MPFLLVICGVCVFFKSSMNGRNWRSGQTLITLFHASVPLKFSFIWLCNHPGPFWWHGFLLSFETWGKLMRYSEAALSGHFCYTLKCYTQMLHPNVTLKCYPKMLHSNVILKCYTQMLHSNATPKCYTQMLSSNVTFICYHLWYAPSIQSYSKQSKLLLFCKVFH